MKIKELIEILKDFNPEADIVTQCEVRDRLPTGEMIFSSVEAPLTGYCWGHNIDNPMGGDCEWNEENRKKSKQSADYIKLEFDGMNQLCDR
jgi:hypothetical protein